MERSLQGRQKLRRSDRPGCAGCGDRLPGPAGKRQRLLQEILNESATLTSAAIGGRPNTTDRGSLAAISGPSSPFLRLPQRPSDRKGEPGSNSSRPPERASGKPKEPVSPAYLPFVPDRRPRSEVCATPPRRHSSAPICHFAYSAQIDVVSKLGARMTEFSFYEKCQQLPKISQGYARRPSRASSGGTKRRRQSTSLSRLDDPVGEYGGVGKQPRTQQALRHRPLRIVGHADDLRAGGGGGRHRGRSSRDADVIGARCDHRAAAGVPQMRRPCLDGRLLLRPGAKLLREGTDPLRRGNDLLRPAYRR